MAVIWQNVKKTFRQCEYFLQSACNNTSPILIVHVLLQPNPHVACKVLACLLCADNGIVKFESLSSSFVSPSVHSAVWLDTDKTGTNSASSSARRRVSQENITCNHNISVRTQLFKRHFSITCRPVEPSLGQWSLTTTLPRKNVNIRRQAWIRLDVAAYRPRELPPPCVTCRLMNGRLVLLMDEPIWPHEPCVFAPFCLDTHKQSDTSGALGAQTLRKGRWWPGLRTAPTLTWETRETGGGNRYPHSYFLPL